MYLNWNLKANLKKGKGPYDWFTVQPIQQINNATRFFIKRSHERLILTVICCCLCHRTTEAHPLAIFSFCTRSASKLIRAQRWRTVKTQNQATSAQNARSVTPAEESQVLGWNMLQLTSEFHKARGGYHRWRSFGRYFGSLNIVNNPVIGLGAIKSFKNTFMNIRIRIRSNYCDHRIEVWTVSTN